MLAVYVCTPHMRWHCLPPLLNLEFTQSSVCLLHDLLYSNVCAARDTCLRLPPVSPKATDTVCRQSLNCVIKIVLTSFFLTWNSCVSALQKPNITYLSSFKLKKLVTLDVRQNNLMLRYNNLF